MELKHVEQFIKHNPEAIGSILNACANNLQEYWEYCERRNDNTLRTALSLTLTMLSLKKRLPDKDVRRSLEFVIRQIFPDGIESCICQGERNFYKRYFMEEE